MRYIEVTSFEELQQKEQELLNDGYRFCDISPVTEYGYIAYRKGVTEVRIKCLSWGK